MLLLDPCTAACRSSVCYAALHGGRLLLLPHLTPQLLAAAAAGYFVLSVTGGSGLRSSSCSLGSLDYGYPQLFQKCTGLDTSGATYLSVYVDQYCGGERCSHACKCAAVHALSGGVRPGAAACRAEPPHFCPSPLPCSANQPHQGRFLC